jgi:hypothetical protein
MKTLRMIETAHGSILRNPYLEGCEEPLRHSGFMFWFRN